LMLLPMPSPREAAPDVVPGNQDGPAGEEGNPSPGAPGEGTMTKQADLFSHVGESAHPAPSASFAVALLALGSVRGVGPKALRALVAAYQDHLGRALEAPVEEVVKVLADAKVAGAAKHAEAITREPAQLVHQAQAVIEDLAARNVQVVPPSALPERLRSIPTDPPLWLFAQGDQSLLHHRPVVAVVGTRSPSEKGVHAAAAVAKVLAPYPVVLVSGLAEGIDERAHRVSLAHGVRNVAFLGHGIDTVFPQGTADVREAIIQRGGLVATEYLPWERFQKRFFVERNRLQAGLADLLIPVEANPTGGTAHTVRFAREFGRPVIAVRWPGANGMVEGLAKAGCPVVDIFTPAGCRQLDEAVRRLAERHGHQTYPLRLGERQLFREIRSRAVRPEDIDRLVQAIRDETAGGRPDGGDQQGGDP
jgi:DNA processing protein